MEEKTQTKTQSTVSRPDDCDAIEELDPLPPPSFYDKVYEVAERFTSTRLGQFVCERADRALKIVEDTAKWSLPQDKMETKLERPMSWPLFLAMIVALRLIRLWLSMAALMIGNGPVTAHDVVVFIQTRRRKLRALRMHGLKAMHSRESAAQAQLKSSSGGDVGSSGTAIGVVAKLGGWFSSAICRPGQQRRIFICPDGPVLPADKAATTAAAERHTTKRRRDEEGAQDLSCDQMLSKYAEEDSDDDSDFIPHPDELQQSSSSSSSDDGDSDSCNHDEEEKRDDAVEAEAANRQSQTNGDPTNNSGSRNNSVELDTGGGHSKRTMPKPLVEIKNEPLTDNDSGNEQLLTPKELNGPSNGDARMGVAEAADVAKTGKGNGTVAEAAAAAPAPKQHNNILFVNGCDYDEPRKSTPGHESAARTAVVMPAAFSSAATAVTPTRTIGELPLSSSCSRSNASSPETSFSSLNSHVPSDDELLFIGLEQCASRSRTSERTTSLTSSTSSSEDIFYSPIGSPTDFNSCIRPVSILKKYPPLEPPFTSDAQSMYKAVDDQNSASENPIASEMPKKHVHHQPTSTTAKQNQSQNQYQNRYRGKNRR